MLPPDFVDEDELLRFAEVLKDSNVHKLLDSLERQYYYLFKDASDDRKRLEAWALARALTEIRASFDSVVAEGERVTLERERAQKRG